MARPRKAGLGYFTLDCVLDSKIDMLLAVHGNDGFAVWIRALQEIYQIPNGQLDLTDSVRRATFAKRCLLPENKVMEIMIFMATEPVLIWDKNLYQKRNLFSSNGISKRVKRVAFIREQSRERQKKQRLNVSNYNTNNSANNGTQNSEQLGNKPNLTIPNHNQTLGSNKYISPTLFEIIAEFKLKAHPNAESEAEKFFNFYESKNWMIGKNKMQKWKASVAGWINRSKEFSQNGNGKNGKSSYEKRLNYNHADTIRSGQEFAEKIKAYTGENSE